MPKKDKTESDMLVLEKIAFSDEPISSYEIAPSFGSNNRSRIHNICKGLEADNFIESELVKNSRNANKKVFRLAIRGFCAYVTFSKLFKKYGSDEKYSDDELRKIKLFLNKWKSLHNGIDVSNVFFMKYSNHDDILKLSDAFKRATATAFYVDMSIQRDKEEKEKDDSKPWEPNEYIYKYAYWEFLIENFLDLPRKTRQAIQLYDIIEIFKTHSGDSYESMMSRLTDEMENKKEDAEETLRCYKKLF